MEQVFEGGVRSQTFLHWTGFVAPKGSVWGGLAHVTDWGVTLLAALGQAPILADTEPPLDGINLWPALLAGGASPRTEMLLSMRDADECGGAGVQNCTHRGELAYRRGPYKLIYGHTALRGNGGDECDWTGRNATKEQINCWNGWSQPRDRGSLRPPPTMPLRPGQPPGTSLYTWGGVLLYNIEADPLEENDLSSSLPDTVRDILQTLEAINASHINQDVMKSRGVPTERCAPGLTCAVPWMPAPAGIECPGAPAPAPPAPAPPAPAPVSPDKSHLTGSDNWNVTTTSLVVHGWVCYDDPEALPAVALAVDGASSVVSVPVSSGNTRGPCRPDRLFGHFETKLQAPAGTDFTKGQHEVSGRVVLATGGSLRLGGSPQCILDGKPVACDASATDTVH